MKADVSVLTQLSGGLYELGLSQAECPGGNPLITMRRSIKRGEILFAAGDIPTNLYGVHAGSFKTCVSSESGRHQVAGFQIGGDFLGLDGIGSDRHGSNGVALEDSQVIAVPISLLTQLCGESADFQHRVHKLLSCEAERGQRMLFLLGSMHAMERVATFLLDLLQRLSARGYSSFSVNLSMSRHDMGSYLGLTVETVSRVLARLKHSGTLEVSRRHIRILDAEALRRAAAGLA